MKTRSNLRDHSHEALLALIFLLSLWPISTSPSLHAQSVPGSESQPTHHSFTMTRTGRGMPTKGARAFWIHNFKAEDGTGVQQFGEEFNSTSGAREALDKLIGKASQVITQGLKKDEKGLVVGKRVEVVFRKGREAAPDFVIAWREGVWLYKIRSTSLELALDFEAQCCH